MDIIEFTLGKGESRATIDEPEVECPVVVVVLIDAPPEPPDPVGVLVKITLVSSVLFQQLDVNDGLATNSYF